MTWTIQKTSDSELYHHGILGQKWGIRRYQNKDGTLTDEGKQRRANEVAKQLAKDKWSWSKDLQQKSFEMVTDLITTDQLKAIKESRDKLNLVLTENRYDGNMIDDEAYSLLETDKETYFSRANEIFRKREGYEPDKEEAFMDAFELAQNDALKKYPDVKKKDAAIGKAVKEHMDLLEQIANNSLIGKYGNMRIDAKNPNSHKVIYAITEAIDRLDKDPILIEKIINGR